MAELVDALVSGTSAARRGGSSPLLGTSFTKKPLFRAAFFIRVFLACDGSVVALVMTPDADARYGVQSSAYCTSSPATGAFITSASFQH